ncbi:60S ribosomal protein l23, partial [Trifolium pratense]
DSDGRFVQALLKKSAGKPLIAEAEAKGLLAVLQWLHDSDRLTRTIVIETDCLQVVQALRSRQKNNTEFGAIIECCRSLVNLYENCDISYVRRQANRVAHDLAQASRFIANLQVLNSCPSCIESTIMNEMN